MKIIYYISHPPAYRNYKENKMPDNYKINSNGSWVGFFDFPAIRQVNGILELTNEFEFEIWQPDLKADKLYFRVPSLSLLMHRNAKFPHYLQYAQPIAHRYF